ncbi:hypothetical protein CDL15_Pgr018543 [Punica granatum]|uniref:Uncharacterized protein n=1 Tax=Punica granatum TaxID=22663 RepID=A0A218WZ39_PUNGR|nr:hypothetical protein CDL15_Pgr018543 [Punica granatum]
MNVHIIVGTIRFEVGEPLLWSIRAMELTAMPPKGMAESPFAPHGRAGSSFAPILVAPYTLLSLVVAMMCARDGSARDLGVRDPRGSDVSRETHGRPPCKGAERSLDPSEALELFAS